MKLKHGRYLLLRPRFLRIRFVFLACVLAASSVTSSFALFSDSSSIASNGFSTGTLSLNVSPASALFNILGIKPADVLYGALTVTNNGSLPLVYTLAATATNPDAKNLAGSLVGEIRKVSSTCDASTFAASVTTIASNVTGLTNLDTDSSRTLAAGASEVLCFQVSLPSSASNLLQGATTATSFVFSAAQP